MIRKIQGGTFDTDTHEYFDESGQWVPSTTQVLQLAGYTNFDGIPNHVLQNAADRGTLLHWLTQVYDEDGGCLSGLPADVMARFEGYKRWREKENFVPTSVEFPLIFSVYGMGAGSTIDRLGTMNGRPALVELKFTAAPSKVWGVQLAAQEMAISGIPTLGRYLRVACHVDKHGVAKTITYRDPMDAQRFIFALGVVWTRIDLGQDIRKELRS